MNVRLFVVMASVAISCGTALHAEVDCEIVARIERAHGAVRNLRSNPAGPNAPSNLAILVNTLQGLDGNVAQDALAEHSSPQEINGLVTFVQLVQSAAPRIRTTTLAEFATSLHATQWDDAMEVAEVALRHMPCGTAHTGTRGDAQGRELPGETTGAADVDRPVSKIENPVEKAIGFVVLLLGLIWGGRFILKWLRQRTIINRRRSKRFATNIQTHLTVNDRVFEAEIVDLSCHGAKVRYWHGTELDSDEPATITLYDDQIAGSRAWSNPLYFAIKFDQPLPIPMVRELAEVSGVDALGRAKAPIEKAATA